MLRSRGFHKEKKPLTPLQAYKRSAPLALREREEEMIDTSELPQRKIHPRRDIGYLRWLPFKQCSVFGLTDKLTGQPHVCWHPEELGYKRFKSDPSHLTKTGMGIKGADNAAISLCRHAHRLQEGATEKFNQRFGINCHEIADRQYSEYQAEQERRK